MIYLYRIYQLFIMLPVALVATSLTAILTIVVCAFGDASRSSYCIAKAWAKVMCWVSLVKVTINGRENIDTKTSYVFVANHVCSMDALFIWSKIKKLCIMAKEELFKFKPFGKILKSQGVFPIARGKKDFGHVYHAVNIVRSKDNNSLLIF